jgi:predicted metal-dependent peptidase
MSTQGTSNGTPNDTPSGTPEEHETPDTPDTPDTPMAHAEIRRMITAALTQIRMRSPFFAALALFAPIQIVETLPTAATDGRDLYFNPEFFAGLSPKQRAGLVLHEVLHAALLHVPRRRTRDALVWNIAADIVVNGVIVGEHGYELPDGAIREAEIEHLSVEEVYSLLLTDPKYAALVRQLMVQDLLEGGLGGSGGSRTGILDERWRAALEEHWRHAMEQARMAARTQQRGDLPAGLARELGALRPAQLDWRAHLWRFLVKTPTDFTGFDRRFVGRGLYLEALDGESVRVHVAVDTSGSVGGREMEAFLGEVRGILGAYPHVRCALYYADAACYGPYPLTAGDPLPQPQGGGGTDFRPFFAAVAEHAAPHEESACVYLTDGYGTFPSAAPDWPVLWVLTPGGIALDAVPFGEAVRLIEDR